MKVVFDTNVLLSIEFTTKGTMGTLRRLWREKKFTVASSEAILSEVEGVLSYPKVQAIHHWSAARKQVYLSNLRHKGRLYPGTTLVAEVLTDPTDTKFLSCAVEADADAVVSGDNHLLNVKHYKGIPIVAPREFLRRFFPQEQAA